MNKKNKVAILIPCFNEELTIRKVVSDWKKELPEAKVYVYDNNSTDNTVKEAKSAGAIVRYEKAQGKGNVVKRMFKDIEADCYIMVDGDDTYPATCGKEMVNTILNKKMDMVIGDRLSTTYKKENKRPFHNFGNKLVRSVINLAFCSAVTDVMTGCRAMSRALVKEIDPISCNFEIETEITILAILKKFRITSIDIEYKDRPEGSKSKLKTIPDGIKIFKRLVRMIRIYNPGVFYGVLGAIAIIVLPAIFLRLR